MGRAVLYQAIKPGTPGFVSESIAATRREIQLSNGLAFTLLSGLATQPVTEVRRYVDGLLADTEKSDEWRARVLFAVYASLKGDPRIETRLTSALAHPSERVRSFAVLAGSEARNHAALPVAWELLESANADVRRDGATAVARLADEPEVRKMLERPWSAEDALFLREKARKRGLDLPLDP